MPEPSGPNSVPRYVPRTLAFQPEGVLAECRKGRGQVDVPPMSFRLPTIGEETKLGAIVGKTWRHMLLRKEVIQPHLPVRLPCYDLVPIANPTLDGSLPCGLSHRLRVLPTFVT
jgi:hypothetical protein